MRKSCPRRCAIRSTIGRTWSWRATSMSPTSCSGRTRRGRCTRLPTRSSARRGFSCRSLMRQSRVEVVCTTDDPTDDLQASRRHRGGERFPDPGACRRWRPDKALAVDKPEMFVNWVDAAGSARPIRRSRRWRISWRRCASGTMLSPRTAAGLSDRGVGDLLRGRLHGIRGGRRSSTKSRAGQAVTPAEVRAFKSFVLHELAVMDAEKGWTMQVHFGALRNVNSRGSPRGGTRHRV